MKIPTIEGAEEFIFFDFLVVGTNGTSYLSENGGGWHNPVVRDIKLVVIPPGKSHSVKLKRALPLKSFHGGLFVGETFKVVAIYRDCAYGHSGEIGPSMWKGIIFSPPATIKNITWKDSDE